jgi:hypothetical protein
MNLHRCKCKPIVCGRMTRSGELVFLWLANQSEGEDERTGSRVLAVLGIILFRINVRAASVTSVPNPP